jgi:uncharacterized membrane-anchored protein
MRKRVALVAAVQLVLVGLAVAPQLSARVTGEEHLLEVRLVDPIDPFRGAYVDLDYPGLQPSGGSEPPSVDDGDGGEVFILLVQDGDLWTMDRYSRTRPDDGHYLACQDRDWAVRCGIESWFVPEDEARELEDALAGDGAVATVRIDGRGNAALVDLAPR